MENPMRRPKVDKVVVNIALGESGEPLERARKILAQLTGSKPCTRRAKKTIRDFGIREGEPIACMATLRGEKAEAFLKKAFNAIGDKVPLRSFDQYGNLSFGIREHLQFPGTRYDPELGTVGMDVSVHVARPGERVQRRRRATAKIGAKHRMTRDESVNLLKERFGIEVVAE
ncbi:MAG: 50S ribosomal protein L5 [Candidatus Bathyarchaeia archaeon]